MLIFNIEVIKQLATVCVKIGVAHTHTFHLELAICEIIQEKHYHFIELMQLKNIQPNTEVKNYVSLQCWQSCPQFLPWEVNLWNKYENIAIFYWQSFSDILGFWYSAFGRLGPNFCRAFLEITHSPFESLGVGKLLCGKWHFVFLNS